MLGKRTVAFLDVLGFRDKIERIPLTSLSDSYEEAIELARILNKKFATSESANSLFPYHPMGERWCNRQILSDAIILVSLNSSAESSLKLMLYARTLVQVFLTLGFSIRGGISYGEIYKNHNTRVILGKALTSAYKLEKNQEWLGVAIDNSVEKNFPELFNNILYPKELLNWFFPVYLVPLKEEKFQEYRILNWRFNMIIEEGTKSLLEKANLNKDNKKFNNTLKYLEWVRKSGAVYIKEGVNRPIEMSAFFVGATKPPFKHGDEY